MAAMAMTACSSLPKDVTLGPNGFTWVGPDGATITAQGLEDAAKQLLQHLIDLEPQLPGAQDIFDGYNDKLTEVLQGKQGFAPRGPSSSGPSIAP